ncbi:10007_t:CDS:10, partial [Acaulospora colombiana]
DMAVLEAVRGWDSLNPDAKKEEPSESGEQASTPAPQEPETNEWNESTISSLLKEDIVSLLLQHDAHIAEEDGSSEECNEMTTEGQLFSPMQVSKESLVSRRATEEWEYWHNQYHSIHVGDPQPVERLLGDTVVVVYSSNTLDVLAALHGAGCWAESSKNPDGPLTGIGSSVSGSCASIPLLNGIEALTSIFETFIADTATESQKGNEHENQINVQVGAITMTLDEEEDGMRSSKETKDLAHQSLSKDLARLFVAFTTSSMAVASFTSEDNEPSVCYVALWERRETSASVAVSGESVNDKLRGVLPARQSLYVPSGAGTWKCLSGDKEIPWSKVNDDFCDCPDGSDEPGKMDSFFGLLASVTKLRLVATLEKECCDGSDESFGVCPNICEEVGKEHRKKLEAEAKLRRTKEKKRVQASIAALKAEVEAKKREESHAKILLDHTESMSQASLNHKKQSRKRLHLPSTLSGIPLNPVLALFQSLEKHSNALKSLQTQYKSLQEREKQLSDVLRNLKEGYNPNYQDMAVLEA